jgi:hypothetical protein
MQEAVSAPGPGGQLPRSYDSIGLASALSNIDRSGTSSALDSATNTYIYALANLGAVMNHHEPEDDVGSMRVIVGNAAGTVRSLCQNVASQGNRSGEIGEP